MKKVCKIRIYPNKTQQQIILDTLGCCRYIQNMYIEYNLKIYEEEKRFLSGYEFSKIVNKLKHNDSNYTWISSYSSKAIKDSIMNGEKSFKRFFKKKNGFPHFKSRKRLNKESFYFIKNNIHYIDKNHIKIPILGKIRITEYNYLPDIRFITSGRVVRDYDKYYIIFIYNKPHNYSNLNNITLGADVGIKNYITMFTSTKEDIYIKHFKDYNKYKSLNNKIIKFQQILSNKVEVNYNIKLNEYMDKHNGEEPSIKEKNIMKGKSYCTSHIHRLQKKIRVLKTKQKNIRKNFIHKLVNYITARIKPSTITIENLGISKMIKHDKTSNTRLHKYILESGFYYFKTQLISKCEEYGITLRIADKYFASSKICSSCGTKNKHLTLSDRLFICDCCGLNIDRDLNAAINLLNLKNKNCIIYA